MGKRGFAGDISSALGVESHPLHHYTQNRRLVKKAFFQGENLILNVTSFISGVLITEREDLPLRKKSVIKNGLP